MKTWKTPIVVLLIILVALFSVSLASAGGSNPFKGQWVGTDSFDGSTLRLTIAGNSAGPLRVTWTESYFTLCEGEPGIGRGTGTVAGANTLDAEIDFTCFTTGTTLNHVTTFTYDPGTDTLTDGTDTWYRAGSP